VRWLGERLRPAVSDVLLDPGAATAPYLRRRELERLLLAANSDAGGRRVWALVVLELWLKGVYAVRPVVTNAVAM
jgi:hypothetical protein